MVVRRLLSYREASGETWGPHRLSRRGSRRAERAQERRKEPSAPNDPTRHPLTRPWTGLVCFSLVHHPPLGRAPAGPPAPFPFLGSFGVRIETTGTRCPRNSTLWAVGERASPKGLARWERPAKRPPFPSGRPVSKGEARHRPSGPVGPSEPVGNPSEAPGFSTGAPGFNYRHIELSES
jgi:hypothetical protein